MYTTLDWVALGIWCSVGRMSSALTSPEIEDKSLNSCLLSAFMDTPQYQLDCTCLKALFDSKVV